MGQRAISANGNYKNSSWLRALFLSGYNKVEADYKPRIYSCLGYYFCIVLAAVVIVFFQLSLTGVIT